MTLDPQVFPPDFPARVAEVSAAVSASIQIDREHADSASHQLAAQRGNHVARGKHFIGERMHMQRVPALAEPEGG